MTTVNKSPIDRGSFKLVGGTDRFVVSDAVALVESLRKESQSERDAFEGQWAKNRQLEIGKHWDNHAPEGRTHLTVNIVREQINSTMSQMIAQRPRVTLPPVDRGRAQNFYIDPDAGRQLAGRLGLENEIRIKQGEEPISIPGVFEIDVPPQENDALFGRITIRRNQAKALVESGLLTDEGLIPATDATLGEFAENIIQGFWEIGQWDWRLAEQKRAALVLGHRDVLMQWNEKTQTVDLFPVLEKDSWIDPNPRVTDIDQAQYYIVDQVISLDHAISMSPEHEDVFKRFTTDPSSAVTSDGQTISDRYQDIDWERQMVILTTAWIRNQKLTVDGKQKFGLREIRMAGPVELFDGPSAYDDIPAFRYKNLLITDHSYSLGQPEILQDVNKAYNRVVSNANDQIRYGANQQRYMAQSLYEAIQGQPIHQRPDLTIPVPDHLIAEMGDNFVQHIKQPGLELTHLAFGSEMKDVANNDLGSRPDVSRGVADSNARSGVAIGRLQDAASRSVAQTSFWFEKADTRMVRLCLEMIRKFMKPEEAIKYSDKWPKEIMKELFKDLDETKYNVRVELATSRGQMRDTEMQKAFLLRQAGAMDVRTLLDKTGDENPERTISRMQQEQLENAQIGAQVQEANARIGAQAPQPNAAG